MLHATKSSRSRLRSRNKIVTIIRKGIRSRQWKANVSAGRQKKVYVRWEPLKAEVGNIIINRSCPAAAGGVRKGQTERLRKESPDYLDPDLNG